MTKKESRDSPVRDSGGTRWPTNYTSSDKRDSIGSGSPGRGRRQPLVAKHGSDIDASGDPVRSSVSSGLQTKQSPGSKAAKDYRSRQTAYQGNPGNESRRRAGRDRHEPQVGWDPNQNSVINSPRRYQQAFRKSLVDRNRNESSAEDLRAMHKVRSSPQVGKTEASLDTAHAGSQKRYSGRFEAPRSKIHFYREEQIMDLQERAMSNREPRETKKMTEVKRENEMLKQELQKVKDRLDEVSRGRKIRLDLDQAYQMVKDKQDQCTEANRQIQELEQKNRDARKLLRSSKKAILTFGPQYHEIEKQVRELQSQSERQINEHKSSCQRVMSLYEDEIERLMDQMDSLAKKYSDLLTHVEDGVTQGLIHPSFSLSGFYFGET